MFHHDHTRGMNDLELETQINSQTTDLPYEMAWDFGVANVRYQVDGRVVSKVKNCSAPNRNTEVVLQEEKGEVKSL